MPVLPAAQQKLIYETLLETFPKKLDTPGNRRLITDALRGNAQDARRLKGLVRACHEASPSDGVGNDHLAAAFQWLKIQPTLSPSPKRPVRSGSSRPTTVKSHRSKLPPLSATDAKELTQELKALPQKKSAKPRVAPRRALNPTRTVYAAGVDGRCWTRTNRNRPKFGLEMELAGSRFRIGRSDGENLVCGEKLCTTTTKGAFDLPLLTLEANVIDGNQGTASVEIISSPLLIHNPTGSEKFLSAAEHFKQVLERARSGDTLATLVRTYNREMRSNGLSKYQLQTPPNHFNVGAAVRGTLNVSAQSNVEVPYSRLYSRGDGGTDIAEMVSSTTVSTRVQRNLTEAREAATALVNQSFDDGALRNNLYPFFTHYLFEKINDVRNQIESRDEKAGCKDNVGLLLKVPPEDALRTCLSAPARTALWTLTSDPDRRAALQTALLKELDDRSVRYQAVEKWKKEEVVKYIIDDFDHVFNPTREGRPTDGRWGDEATAYGDRIVDRAIGKEDVQKSTFTERAIDRTTPAHMVIEIRPTNSRINTGIKRMGMPTGIGGLKCCARLAQYQ